ncbi:MAG: SDR family oxidoreductase [Nitrospirota bacterium]|nr:SDR family oxidoreductase [Nitrospirota bacterium]
MDLQLEGRHVLITGASTGIGRALAAGFAAEGARVYLNARPGAHLDAAVRDLRARGARVHALPGDLTMPRSPSASDMEGLLAPLLEGPGCLDVLVHNAGSVGPFAGLEATTDADWLASLELNLMAAVRLTRAALPLLRAAAQPNMVCIGSTGVERPDGRWPHYHAAKAALANFARSLAVELAPEGIRVNTVSPGPVWTSSWEREAAELAAHSGQSPELAAETLRHRAARRVPLGRIGEVDDLVGICLLLASSRAAWITGAEIAVDGGLGVAGP